MLCFAFRVALVAREGRKVLCYVALMLVHYHKTAISMGAMAAFLGASDDETANEFIGLCVITDRAIITVP